MAETQQPIRRELVARIHTAFDGIPFYDEELQVAQSDAHRIMVFDFGTIFGPIAQEARLGFLADQPIWYLEPDTNVQKAFYGDCVLDGVDECPRPLVECVRAQAGSEGGRSIGKGIARTRKRLARTRKILPTPAAPNS